MVNIVERELGTDLHFSVGTALAFEEIIKRLQLLQSTVIYLNVRTLWRNYITAYSNPAQIDVKTHIELFEEEVTTLISLIPNIMQDIDVILYFPSYKSIHKIFPHAKILPRSTAKQIAYDSMERSVLEALYNKDNILLTDTKLPGKNQRALLLSHYPIDLLSKNTFRSLNLLESHTGNIRREVDWIKKITRNQSYLDLPFNYLTIQLLGDGMLLGSKGAKYVKPIIELAKNQRWTNSTTMAKIKYDLKKIIDPYLKEVLISMGNGGKLI